MPICNRHLICDSDSQRPLELRVQDSGAASGHSVRKGQQTDSLATGPLEIRKSPAFMLRMENEAQRKKPPTSQVYQHLGQTLDAYTDEGLSLRQSGLALCTWRDLFLCTCSQSLLVGGTAVPQHGPSRHPCSRPALREPVFRCSEFQDACPWAHGSCSLCGLCLWVGVGPGPAFNDTVFQGSGSWTLCAPAGKLQA